MAREAFIFDCDGTILNTLPDLVCLTNATLSEFGLPQHTSKDILSYVGAGARALIDQAVPQQSSEELRVAVLNRWRELYPTFGYDKTVPYKGMPSTLDALKRMGVKVAVLSNKFDAATKEVTERYYPGVFDAIHGECPEYPRKPDPQGLLKTIEELGVRPEETVYVGDSPVDIQVSKRAGVLAAAVSWGYNPEPVLLAEDPDVLLHSPENLLGLLSK